MGRYTEKNIKRLFARSGNICAFPKCFVLMIDEPSGSVVGEICHIKASKPSGARYDASQTEVERNEYENLILLCSMHHKVIDDDADSYSVERLKEIKTSHETQFRSPTNAIKDELLEILEPYIRKIIAKNNVDEIASDQPPQELSLTESFLHREKEVAAENEFNNYRDNWHNSARGCEDVTTSVNKLFSLIGEKYHINQEVFYSKNIVEVASDEFERAIENENFGVHVRIVNFDWCGSRIPKDLFLEIFLYEKHYIYGKLAGYFRENISRICLIPDVTNEQTVIWCDVRDNEKILTPEEICDQSFDLLIAQITKANVQ